MPPFFQYFQLFCNNCCRILESINGVLVRSRVTLSCIMLKNGYTLKVLRCSLISHLPQATSYKMWQTLVLNFLLGSVQFIAALTISISIRTSLYILIFLLLSEYFIKCFMLIAWRVLLHFSRLFIAIWIRSGHCFSSTEILYQGLWSNEFIKFLVNKGGAMAWIESTPAGNYIFKFNNRNTRIWCEICSKLIYNLFTICFSAASSETSHTSKMELFAEYIF